MTQNLASLLGTADQTLLIENVIWTHIFSEWLDWSHFPQTRKINSPYNQTQYTLAIIFLAVLGKCSTTESHSQSNFNLKN
jgi:hypothetical protein